MDRIHVQPNYLIILVPLSMVLSIPVRLMIKRYNLVVPHNFFMGLFGICLGCAMMWFHGRHFIGISNISPDIVLSVFIPIYIVFVLYRIDFNVFKRCLLQSTCIMCFKVTLHVTFLGALFKFILQSEWSYPLSLLAALCFIPIQPFTIILMFKELAKHKFLGTMLETEAVLASVPTFILFDVLFEIVENEVAWYQSILHILKSAFGGTAIGCILGKLTSIIMCWIYNEPQGLLCVFIGSIFFTYFFCQYVVCVSGPLAVVCLVCFVVNAKHHFSSEVDICIDSFWQTLYYMAENAAMLIITSEMLKFVYDHFELKSIYDIIIIYFCGNVLRFMFFQIVRYPKMKSAYQVNVKGSLVLGWSGIKGSLNMMCALMIYFRTANNEIVKHFPVEMTIYVFLTLLVNSSTMKIVLHLTGLSELSSTRRTNMNNCMKFILEKRFSVINILRMNRYLSDANWSIVFKETIMKHPYRIKLVDEQSDDEDDDTLWNATSAICPICFKDISFDMTDKELAEVLKEAQIKIIKSKKVSIIKQYETGIINRSSLDVLIHVFEIMIESNQEDNAVDLSSYLMQHRFLNYLGKLLVKLDTHRMTVPPHGGQLHKLCYYLMMHFAYDYFVFTFNIIYFVVNAYYIHTRMFNIYHTFCVAFFNLIFLTDFFVKILGYASNVFVALKIYFRLYWNIFDLFLLILSLVDLGMASIGVPISQPVAYLIVKIIGLVHILKIFFILEILYRKFINMIDVHSDEKSSAGYDLATALLNCSDEILEFILQIIEVNKIREIYMKKIHKERQDLIKMMDTVQKARPWVAITMKTKQVIRIALTSMEESLNQLKFSGFVDNIEYSTIYKEIFEKQKFLRNLKYVHPLPPKMIFTEVPWMANDDETLEFLYNNVQIRQWDVGDVICKSGKKLPCLMIVVTGYLKLNYQPKASTIERYLKIGNLPIVDYLSSLNITKPFEDNMMSGSSIGELSLLTGRAYDCDITADAPGQGYVLTNDKVRDAMKLKNDPINGLEARLWKHATLNIAIAVLMDSVAYESYTHDEIKLKLGRAFMPSLRCYKMFVVIPEIMEDIILMEGIAADYDSTEIFIAPLLLPRNIKKIVFPRNGLFDVDCAQTMLLIIPSDDVGPYYIMEREEDIAELVSLPSSSCLLHSGKAQQKKSKAKRRMKKATQSKMPLEIDLEANMIDTLHKNITDAKEKEQMRHNTTKKNDLSGTSLQ